MVNDLFSTMVEESSLKSGCSATVKTVFAHYPYKEKQRGLMTVVDIYFKKITLTKLTQYGPFFLTELAQLQL